MQKRHTWGIRKRGGKPFDSSIGLPCSKYGELLTLEAKNTDVPQIAHPDILYSLPGSGPKTGEEIISRINSKETQHENMQVPLSRGVS